MNIDYSKRDHLSSDIYLFLDEYLLIVQMMYCFFSEMKVLVIFTKMFGKDVDVVFKNKVH